MHIAVRAIVTIDIKETLIISDSRMSFITSLDDTTARQRKKGRVICNRGWLCI